MPGMGSGPMGVGVGPGDPPNPKLAARGGLQGVSSLPGNLTGARGSSGGPDLSAVGEMPDRHSGPSQYEGQSGLSSSSATRERRYQPEGQFNETSIAGPSNGTNGNRMVLEIFGASPSDGAGVSEIKAYEQTYSLMKLFGVTPCDFTSDELDYARYKKSKGVASKASVLHQISDSDDELMISDADDEWKPSAKQPKASMGGFGQSNMPPCGPGVGGISGLGGIGASISGGMGDLFKKAKKDPNAPRRAQSAFFWFSKEERSKIDLGVRRKRGRRCISKELGKKWNQTDKNTKKKYEDMALNDKKRYEVIMK